MFYKHRKPRPAVGCVNFIRSIRKRTSNGKNEKKLTSTLKEKIFYGMGDVGVNVVWMLPSSFLMLYYTDNVRMSAAFIGTMMLICRLFDGISDILMGILIDKTKSKYGKARPWFFFMGIPLILSVFFTFFVPSGLSDSGKQVYAFVTYFTMSVICYTAVNLSYHAMLPRFSLTSQDRSVTSVIRSIFSLIITIVVSTITTMLLSNFGGDKSQKAWSTVVIIYGVIAMISILLTFLNVKEKEGIDEEKSEIKRQKVSTLKSVKILLSSRYFYISILLFIAFYISNGTSGIMIYYARDVFGNADLMGLMSISSMIPIMIGSPFCPLLLKKFGKRNVMMAGMIISTISGLLMLLNPTNLILYMSLSVIKSFGSAPLLSAMYTLAGDIVDYNQWKHGIRTEGIATSVNSMGMKLGTGLGSALLGWLLEWGKYDKTLTTQPASAIQAMIIIAIVIPIIIYIVSAIALGFWDLEKYQNQVTEYLNK